jgi:hypothetical protein
MKTFSTTAFALVAVALLALVVAPTIASAAGGMGSKAGASTTCKSGKSVKNARECKENGGRS